MADGSNEGLAADAAAYIARSGNLVPRSRGDALELRRQSELLRQWAREKQRLVDFTPPSGPQTRGTEHEVFFDETGGRVFKRTHPGTFGSAPTERGLRRTATPYFYLVRLELMNRIFDADLRLEGVTDANELSIVTSEPWAQPADPRRPLPSSEEIASFMSDLGFALVPGAPFEWFRTRDRVRVSDARPDNFIKSKRGVVPIDLVISSE